MKKLLIISTNTIHVLNYINLVHDYFDDIHLITNTVEDKFDYGDIKISYTEFSFRKPLDFYKSIGFVKQIIKTENPTVIHVHQLGTHAFLTLMANKKSNIPSVYTAWGSDVLQNPETGYFYKKTLTYILRHGKNFTSDSTFMAEVMNKIAGRKLNTLIANFGINIDNTEGIEKQNILYSNRQLKSLYRIDKIIEAFARFINEENSTDWKLIIGAEGEEKQSLIELAEKLNVQKQVEFVGWLEKEQNSHYYNIAKYYISIPESDATSISLLEAMAAGCVPILSDLPANREWIDDGVNGIIVKDLSQNYIKEAMTVDYKNATEINKKIIAEHGTKEANRKKFIHLYEQIITQTI